MYIRTKNLLDRISCELLGCKFLLVVDTDKRDKSPNARVYIRLSYIAPCSKTHTESVKWFGRKWYLSEYMTDDEIVKTAWCAFEMAVKHELLEGFKVDGKTLFNPHVNFEELLKISHKEITRK